MQDPAVLETLSPTGIEPLELTYLENLQYGHGAGTMLVHGKEGGDRHGSNRRTALTWIRKYLDAARGFQLKPDDGILFLTADRKGSRKPAKQPTSRYVAAAETGETGASHLFRHTMATHMLEDGANTLRPEMLGHEELIPPRRTPTSRFKAQEIPREDPSRRTPSLGKQPIGANRSRSTT